MNKRITFYKRATAEDGKYGRNSGGEKYELVGICWAGVTFNKGVKSLNLGAVDAYEVVMFRLRYRSDIDRWCLIKCQNRWYEIESFNANYQENQIQITAHERVNQQVNIIDPTVVDLGLPSGTLWGKVNLGQVVNLPTTSDEKGLFFSWGNTDGHDSEYDFTQEAYAETDGAALTTDIPVSNDAAQVMLGENWYMPTLDDFTELMNNTTLKLNDSHSGLVLKSKINGKEVFFTLGYYWSATLDVNDIDKANQLLVYAHYSPRYQRWEYYLQKTIRYRYNGLLIRPIKRNLQ